MGVAVNPVLKRIEYMDVTIASAASITAEIDLSGRVLTGVLMPAAWTTANLTFQATDVSGGTYGDLYYDATEKSLTVAAGLHVSFDPSAPIFANFIKIRSGTSATPVAQASTRTLKLALYAA